MIEVGLIVVIVLAVVVSFMIVRRGSSGGQPVEHTSVPDVQLDPDFQEQLRDLATQGHTEQAIKTLRKRAKLSPHQATLVIQALMVGQSFPAPSADKPTSTEATPTAVVDDDLLQRLHALVAQDPLKRTAALQLLRDRTGMSAKEARRFIDAL